MNYLKLILALALVLSCCGSAAVVTACAGGQGHSVVQASEVHNSAVLALTVLDEIEAARLRALAEPTEADLLIGRERVRRLKAARDSLELAGKAIEAGRDARPQLVLALKWLRLAVDEMTESGLRVPEEVGRALHFAEQLLESGVL